MRPRIVRSLWFLVFFLTIAGTIGLPQVSSGQSVFGGNVIVNGGAEAGPGALGKNIVTVPGWQTTGAFTALSYGGEFPNASSPGPADRGNNLFAGGPGKQLSTGLQVIDVAAAAPEIDQNAVAYQLTGYLGGYSIQADHADLTATFKDGNGIVLGSATIGPVTPADRGNRTALVPRSASGILPAGTRGIDVLLRMVRIKGEYNDGYADNLSLVLTTTAAATRPTQLPARPVPELPKPAKLKISTQPGAAQVYLDDVFKGSTSEQEGILVIENLAPGSHRLRLTLPGYKEWNQNPTLVAGETLPVTAKLEPAGPKPLSFEEVEQALKDGVSKRRVGELVKKFGVDFTMTPEQETRLRDTGADGELLYLISSSKK